MAIDSNTISLLHFDYTTDETGKAIIPYGGATTSAAAANGTAVVSITFRGVMA